MHQHDEFYVLSQILCRNTSKQIPASKELCCFEITQRLCLAWQDIVVWIQKIISVSNVQFLHFLRPLVMETLEGRCQGSSTSLTPCASVLQGDSCHECFLVVTHMECQQRVGPSLLPVWALQPQTTAIERGERRGWGVGGGSGGARARLDTRQIWRQKGDGVGWGGCVWGGGQRES